MTTISTLFKAVELRDVAAGRQLVGAGPRSVNERDNRDARRPTALHVAARFGHADVANALLRLGADPNALDAEHTSPLGVAAVFGHADIVAALIDAQAHTSIRNKFGLTPLAAALAGEQGTWKNYSSALPESWQAIVRALRSESAEL